MVEDVTVVVPAFNEEDRIATVLKVLVRARNKELISDIIVVDDGSSDNTAKIAAAFPVQLISLPQNKGKGAALAAGIQAARSDIILFLDADIVGLKNSHLERLTEAIVGNPKLGMTTGIFRSSSKVANFVNKLLALSGQRAVRKSWAKDLPGLETSRYGADMLITLYAKEHGIKTIRVYLDHLKHIYKEQKGNFFVGFFRYRMKMYLEIAKVLFSSVR